MQPTDVTLWNRVKPVLDQALTLPPQDRGPFLDRACASDSSLRLVVERCLDELAQLEQSAFMEVPAAARVPLNAIGSPALDADNPNDGVIRIGPYQTVRPIGHGGMGTIYLAERVDGQFEHQVALKLIKWSPYTKTIEPRFLHERQILARLQHPNIARLYDGGVTDDGRPYFVMEYIQGQSITDYCDTHQLSIKKRLALFLQVCTALQYAHQNLVVHRDVKPSNILVTEPGEVKLLDFGIAKMLSGVTETVVTQPGGPALTPDYAAPEQVKGEAITAATDVYALGILLYELLSGHRPYQVQGTSMADWVRVICETEPYPPSLLVAQQQDARDAETVLSEPLSTARATTPLRLRRQLAGDLDTIVLKALRKEPERRYGSVEAFASDITRYLENIPILARRDTLGYRLGKFAVRHRFGIGVLAVLVVLVAGFTWRTVVERNRAETSAIQANEVSDFLVDLFTMSDPLSAEEVRGGTTEVRVFLERGASQIEALSDQGEVQSMLRGVLGRLYRALGEYEEAERFLRAALEQRRALYGEQSVEVAQSMHDLGQLLRLWGGEAGGDGEGNVYGEAEALFRSALALRKALLGEEHVDVAETLNNLAVVLREQGKYAEAEAMFRESLALWKKSTGEESRSIATVLNNLAAAFREQGKYAEAETMLREALVLWKKSLGEEHPEVAVGMENLANILYRQGSYAEAETMHREVLALRKKLLGEEHPDVAAGKNNLALVLRQQGKYAEAETMHREALASWKKSLGEENFNVAAAQNNLALVLSHQGKYAEAETMFRAVLALLKKLLGDEHPHVATVLENVADVQHKQGNPAEAEVLFREVLALRKKVLDEDHPNVAATLNNLAEVLSDQGNYAEAEIMFKEALASWTKRLGDDHANVATALHNLAKIQVAYGNYPEAEAMLQNSFETYEQALGVDHPDTQEVIGTFTELYTAWGKPEEATRYQVMRLEDVQ